MAQWIKSWFTSPLAYGLKQINIVAMEALTMFFNNYGNKILKIDSQIIKKNECVGDLDVFYLYPIHIENQSYNFDLNTCTFKKGLISDISIAFPWKSLLADQTMV